MSPTAAKHQIHPCFRAWHRTAKATTESLQNHPLSRSTISTMKCGVCILTVISYCILISNHHHRGSARTHDYLLSNYRRRLDVCPRNLQETIRPYQDRSAQTPDREESSKALGKQKGQGASGQSSTASGHHQWQGQEQGTS